MLKKGQITLFFIVGIIILGTGLVLISLNYQKNDVNNAVTSSLDIFFAIKNTKNIVDEANKFGKNFVLNSLPNIFPKNAKLYSNNGENILFLPEKLSSSS